MLQTVLIIVTGKVQGVFYRQTTKEKANELGIKGEVRNMIDESVHIIATGTKEQLAQFAEWCWQGPPRANVKNITIEETNPRPFDKFSIVR